MVSFSLITVFGISNSSPALTALFFMSLHLTRVFLIQSIFPYLNSFFGFQNGTLTLSPSFLSSLGLKYSIANTLIAFSNPLKSNFFVLTAYLLKII